MLEEKNEEQSNYINFMHLNSVVIIHLFIHSFIHSFKEEIVMKVL